MSIFKSCYGFAFSLFFCCHFFSSSVLAKESVVSDVPKLSAQQVALALAPHAKKSEFPNRVDFAGYGRLAVEYSMDRELHEKISSIYKSYKPDFSAFVAIEPETGRILSLTSYVKHNEYPDNFSLNAQAPAASLFKVVSAAAGIDQGLVNIKTVIPFNGKSTTLYKSQILKHKDNKYTRRMPFSEAFARSSNPVFGRLGMEYLSAEMLRDYSHRMGFGKSLSVDLPLEQSSVNLPFIDPWEMAEASSGFTKDILLSPLHAASMMSGILNGGELSKPYIVESVKDGEGNVLYQGKSQRLNEMFSKSTAKKIKEMMRETVRIGSARKAFSKHKRYKAYKGTDFGGKTGSLSGYSPKGRYNWFMGFGERNGKKVAYASLVVYRDKWVVRPATVTFEVLNYMFKQEGMVPQ